MIGWDDVPDVVFFVTFFLFDDLLFFLFSTIVKVV